MIEEATKALMTTVKSVPELRAQKKKLDSHMNLLYTLLQNIKDRTLDKCHELGQRILSGIPLQECLTAFVASRRAPASQLLRCGVCGSVSLVIRMRCQLTSAFSD